MEPATARVSSLEDIAIFTHGEEVPLSAIFMKIHEDAQGGETLSHKAPGAELKEAFKGLVPEYDEERVYVSDIKKVFQWYNLLHKHNMLEIIDKEEEGGESAGDEADASSSAKESKEKTSGEEVD